MVLKRAGKADRLDTPKLILDCANTADPHSLPLNHKDTYVVQIDLLYKFRDALKQTPFGLEPKTIHVTSYNHLFHYGNEKENKAVLEHCWELMAQLAKKYDVYVEVPEKHKEIAQRYLWDTQ